MGETPETIPEVLNASEPLTPGVPSPPVHWRASRRKGTAFVKHFTDRLVFRGSSAAHVLRRWGAVLDPELRTSACYDLSEHRDHVDVFVSHNWSTSRRDKFLVLAFHLNMHAALLCTLLVAAIAGALTVLGVLPTIEFTNMTQSWWLGPWCQLLGTATFLLVLFCWQEVGACGCRGDVLFLDKACIHQTDEELKRKGIEHLATFLYYSWSMLVCYSDVYLKKLWTVYEVASFIMLNPGGAMIIRHPFLPKSVFAGMAVVVAFNISWHLVHRRAIHDLIPAAGVTASLGVSAFWFVPLSVAFSAVAYAIALEKTKIKEHVQQFKFAAALCYAEEDRAVVQKNIVGFLKATYRVEPDASDEDAMAKFEEIVRQEVPQLFAASMGRGGFPYLFIVCCLLPYVLQSFDYASAAVLAGESAAVIVYQLLAQGTMGLAIGPLVVALHLSLAERAIKSGRIGRTASIALLSVEFFFVNVAGYGSIRILGAMAEEGSIIGAIALVTVTALLAILTGIVYRPMPTARHRRRLK